MSHSSPDSAPTSFLSAKFKSSEESSGSKQSPRINNHANLNQEEKSVWSEGVLEESSKNWSRSLKSLSIKTLVLEMTLKDSARLVLVHSIQLYGISGDRDDAFLVRSQ